MKKRIIIYLCLMVVSLSFFGCAKTETKKIRLSLWNSSQTMVDWYNETVIPEFLKQNPEVEGVDVLYMPIADFTKKLAVVLPSGDVPDIMEIEDSWATPYVTANYFEPNTPELNARVNQMIPELKNNVSWQGKMWGVPVAPFHELFFYNLDMLKEAGISKIPDTINEVIDAAVKMTKRDESGKIERSGFSMRLGGNPGGTAQKFWVLALLGNGVDIWEESKNQPGKYHAGFDNEAGCNALKMYIDLLYKYEVDDFASMKDSEAFAKEKTAINMREASSSVSISKTGPTVNWITAPMPVGPVQRATFLISLNLYVPKDGKNKDLSRKFIELATSKEMMKVQVVERAGYNPYADVDPTEGLDPRLVPGFIFPKDMHVYTVPVHSAYDMAMTRLGEALPNVFKKAELLDNPEAIKKEIKVLADLVNDAYKEFDEYAE